MNFKLHIYTDTRQKPNGVDVEFEFTKEGWNIWAEMCPSVDNYRKCLPNGDSNQPGIKDSGVEYVFSQVNCLHYPKNFKTILEKIWKILDGEKIDARKAREFFGKIENNINATYSTENEINYIK
ncbi:hypothetical protein [Fusobacterium sp. IOR10]|uniref:hypothetical protein n=1 Tax=Fusobacterium sp. IOR10 TaxID=2665157 RepID=UPI0013D46C68|nr:hypothetical protein [Fusobacterium sp. IOR10]